MVYALLNIGLNVKGQLKLAPYNIVKLIPVEVVAGMVTTEGTEPTFVAALSRPLSWAELFRLSKDLEQDCIAQFHNGQGILCGPKASEWGVFNPAIFIKLDGGTL